jgi:hypothetical protein
MTHIAVVRMCLSENPIQWNAGEVNNYLPSQLKSLLDSEEKPAADRTSLMNEYNDTLLSMAGIGYPPPQKSNAGLFDSGGSDLMNKVKKYAIYVGILCAGGLFLFAKSRGGDIDPIGYIIILLFGLMGWAMVRAGAKILGGSFLLFRITIVASIAWIAIAFYANYTSHGRYSGLDLGELANLGAKFDDAKDDSGVSGKNVGLALLFWPGIIVNEYRASNNEESIDKRVSHLSTIYNEKCSGKNQASSGDGKLTERLRELKGLHDQGLIGDEEYEKSRKRALETM